MGIGTGWSGPDRTQEEPMPKTWNYDKVGRKQVTIEIECRVPLDEPGRAGNNGLEGYDEFSIERVFPNAGLAKHYLTKRWRPPAGAEAAVVTLRYQHWAEDSFEDDQYGYVRDAECITDQIQFGWPDSGDPTGWAWSDLETPR
jgi:hypothetical protein